MNKEKGVWPSGPPAGTMVTTTSEDPDVAYQWVPGSRQWGVRGELVEISNDGHGLYYAVRHPDCTIGWYGANEITII